MNALIRLSLLAAVLAAAPARASCPDGVVTRQSLATSVETARFAFAGENWPIFEYAVQQAVQLLECVDEPLVSEDVAAVHLARGLLLWRAEGASPRAVAALWRYAKMAGEAPPSLDQQRLPFPLPVGLTEAEIAVYSDPTLQAALAGTSLSCSPRLSPPLRGQVLVDGGGEGSCPFAAAPWVFQRNLGAQVVQTAYVAPGGDLPPYPKLRPVLLQVGASTGTVGAGLLIGAALIDRSMREFPPEGWKSDVEVEALWFDRREKLNHGLFISGATLAGVSVVSLGALSATFVW